MKLFSKKRLQIKKSENSITYQWWALSMSDILIVVLLPMSFIYGIGSFMEMEEVIGLEVIHMNNSATLIYWGVWIVLLTHLIFNRSVHLVIDAEKIVYRSRKLFGVNRELALKSIVEIRIVEKANNFTESPADGRDLSTYTLFIYAASGKYIRVKGLSEEDDLAIKETLNAFRK